MGITNDERRRIAANLRESWKPRWHGEKMMHRLREALEIDRSASEYGKFRYYRTVAERLADLIEPSEHVKCVAEVKVDGERLEKLVHDAAVELTGIDRDALLALADEIDRSARRRPLDAWYGGGGDGLI